VPDRRDAAGFAVEEDARRLDAGFVEDADFDAVDRLVEDARFELVDDAERRPDAGLAAVERRDDAGFAVEDLRAVDARRAAGFLAGERLAAAADVDPAPGRSSADTRFARPSTSFRRPLSSSTTRSSSTSRIRLTAPASSPANSWAGPRSDCAPSAVAANVRSTAERTASTASTAPAGALSFLPLFFFFESFFAMAARS
jgi:hypothetical protein